MKSAISCIRFILINATRYQTDDTTLSAELQQLGLPKEHSTAMCRVFSENSSRIGQHLLDTSFTGKMTLFELSWFTQWIIRFVVLHFSERIGGRFIRNTNRCHRLCEHNVQFEKWTGQWDAKRDRTQNQYRKDRHQNPIERIENCSEFDVGIRVNSAPIPCKLN